MTEMVLMDVPLTQIHYDEEFNCRGPISPMDVADLAKSIERDGLMEPIALSLMPGGSGKYRLLAGHRRYIAHKILKRETIPATVRNEVVDEIQARVLNLTENLQRKQLNVLQEAMAIKPFKDFGLSEDETAKRLGASRGWVQVRYLLLKLPEVIQQEVAAGFVLQSDIRKIYTQFRAGGKDAAIETAKILKDTRLLGRKKRRKEKIERSEVVKPRSKVEIELMQDYFFEQTKVATVAHRLLAWCAGHISSNDMHESMKEFCEEKGLNYRIP